MTESKEKQSISIRCKCPQCHKQIVDGATDDLLFSGSDEPSSEFCMCDSHRVCDATAAPETILTPELTPNAETTANLSSKTGQSIKDECHKALQQAKFSFSSARLRHSVLIAAIFLVFGALVVISINLSIDIPKARLETSEALSLLKDGKPEEALSHLELAKARDKDTVKHIGEFAFKDTPEAVLAKASDRLLVFPDESSKLADRAQAYVKLKRFDEAQRDYTKALALGIGRYSVWGDGYSYGSEFIPNYAEFLLQQGKKSQAIALLERSFGVVFPSEEIISLSQKLNIPYKMSANLETGLDIALVLGRASVYVMSDDDEATKKSIKSVDELLAKHPGFGPALLVRAQLKVSTDPGSAIKDANRMLAIYPGQAEALLIRSEAYSRMHDIQAALRDVDLALKQLPESVELLQVRSDLLLKNGNWQAALSDLDKLEEISSQDPDTIFRRVEIFECIGDKGKAAQELRRQILFQRFEDLKSDELGESFFIPDLVNRRCGLLLATGKSREADKEIDEQIKRSNQPGSKYSFYITKSQACLLQGDKEKALDFANKARLEEDELGNVCDESLMQRAHVYGLVPSLVEKFGDPLQD